MENFFHVQYDTIRYDTVYLRALKSWRTAPKSKNKENQKQLDWCIVWNAHNIVFGSKSPAICAQAV